MLELLSWEYTCLHGGDVMVHGGDVDVMVHGGDVDVMVHGQLMCCLQLRSGVMIEGESIKLTIGQSSHMRALTHTLETKGSVNWSRSQPKTN